MQAALRDMRSRLGQKYSARYRWRKNLDRQNHRLDQSQRAGSSRRSRGRSGNSGSGARCPCRARTRLRNGAAPRSKNARQLLERVAEIHRSSPLRTFRARSFRSRQTLGRSRRRHPRGDRFLPVLRATNAVALAGRVSPNMCPGEESYQHYWPRGVALVIAPWNFPLAILCGMVSAALVTGNTVIMKPAEQSRCHAARCSWKFSRKPACRPACSISSRATARSSARIWSIIRCRSDRLHRFARSRAANLGKRRQDAARPARAETRRLRNGRQERHHRRFRRRSRRGDR